MHFEPDYTYHIYNRSNEAIFLNDDNYLYFLKKVNRFIVPYSNILAWCLMPNHFHILLQAKAEGCALSKNSNLKYVQKLSEQFGYLLSSYVQGFNKHTNRKGRLFAHKTQAKCLNDLTDNKNYGLICFNYIHQNPVEANLCSLPKQWMYSSWLDYAGYRNGKLIEKHIAAEMFDLDLNDFENQNFEIISEKNVSMLY